MHPLDAPRMLLGAPGCPRRPQQDDLGSSQDDPRRLSGRPQEATQEAPGRAPSQELPRGRDQRRLPGQRPQKLFKDHLKPKTPKLTTVSFV